MSSLDTLIGQVFDKLSDVVLGPVQCVVNATASVAGAVIPQGQQGTLPDGRVVRVTAAVKVQTTATPVPVRLLYLAPASPTGKNFVAIATGAVVTWTSPPSGINATAVGASAFGANAAMNALGYVFATSAIEHDLIGDDDLYAAGSNGLASLVVLAPELAAIPGSDHLNRKELVETRWKIRVNLSSYDKSKQRRVLARQALDALMAAIEGAAIGNGPARFLSWKLTRQSSQVNTYEFAFSTKHVARGRQLLQPQPGVAPPFVVGITQTVNDSPTSPSQPNPFQVSDNVTVT